MSFPKALAIIALLLFGTIITVAIFKDNGSSTKVAARRPIEVRLDDDMKAPAPAPKIATNSSKATVVAAGKKAEVKQPRKPAEQPQQKAAASPEELPEANRVAELFNTSEPKLPIVETVTYKSRVSWLKGRPAWLSDYASHYQTSRHFIARSLHGKPDYFKQDLADGDRFNVLSLDKDVQFHLVIDTSRCKMWLYYLDNDTHERVLLKTYRVCLGRPDSAKTSGLLTPLGKYSLGNKIAIYKPKMMGYHNSERIEMITVFGTRWIPFDKEISGCTAPAKGFGIHGVPWTGTSGKLHEDLASVGKYESDGCIRMATDDIEEIFAIIITKPAVVEIVRDFHEAKLPGEEKGG